MRLFASRSDRTIGPRIALVTWRILGLRLLKIEVVNGVFCTNLRMRYHIMRNSAKVDLLRSVEVSAFVTIEIKEENRVVRNLFQIDGTGVDKRLEFEIKHQVQICDIKGKP